MKVARFRNSSNRKLLVSTRKLCAVAAWMLAGISLCAAQNRILWKDPGAVERIDFANAPGGAANAPRPPYHFVVEEFKGNSPKVVVRDSMDVLWRVKGGLEPRAESFATRLVAAVGYHADPTWFIARGKIQGATGLKRAARFIRPDGTFSNASFERRNPDLKSLPQDWTWNDNPFLGTEQLKGLKVLIMLLANWDNKDARDKTIGSNTGVAELRTGARIETIYRVTDWGQALGGWGPGMKPKTWDCARFTAQTPTFVQSRAGPYWRFGFTGHHNNDFKNDITTKDVRWLMLYLGRITDAQLRSGLKASGATPAEAACFATQLRKRINQLDAQ